MFGLSMRAYIVIGVAVGVIIYLMGLVAGEPIVQFFTEIRSNALANGISLAIATIIVDPFIFAFSNPLGAILAGLLWPLIIVWFVLLFLIIIIAAFSSGYNTAATGTDQFNQ